jgi:hypothetical protein
MFTSVCAVSVILASLGQCGPGGCAIGAGYGYGYGYAPTSYGYAYGASCAPASYGYAQPMAATWHPALMQGYGYGHVPHYHYAAPSYSYAASPTWAGTGAACYSGGYGYGVPYTPYYPVAQSVGFYAGYAPRYAPESPMTYIAAPAYAEPVVAAVPVRGGLFGGGRGFHPFRRLFGGGGGARRGLFRGGCG